jgi:integrase
VPEAVKAQLTIEELEALAAHPLGGRLGAAITRGFFFTVYTGLRVSDVAAMSWGMIERLPKPLLMKRQEKTERVVGVPLSPAAWALIKDDAIHPRDELVFPDLSRSKTSPTQYFTTWAARAGIDKKIGWHTARHTFAVLSLEAGTDLYTVSKLLGHTNLATTQVYAKATDGMRREAVERLPEFEIRKG